MSAKSRQAPIPPSAKRTEIKYLDIWGSPVSPDKAVRVITTEYDEAGNLVSVRMLVTPSEFLWSK